MMLLAAAAAAALGGVAQAQNQGQNQAQNQPAPGTLARAHLGNPNLFDHVIQIQNNCPQSITTQVCYLHSYECLSIAVTGHGSREAILGTQPSIRDFEYEFRERF